MPLIGKISATNATRAIMFLFNEGLAPVVIMNPSFQGLADQVISGFEHLV